MKPKALLVAVRSPETTELAFESSLAELARLVTTLGYEVTGRVVQARPSLAPAAVLGEGKLAELAELTGGSGKTRGGPKRRKDKARLRREAAEPKPEIDVETGIEHDDGDEGTESDDAPDEDAVALVAVDHEISPSQLRNLERATGTNVLDRTGVIIEIFHRHARSREARLEVEIARLSYTAPRIRESPRGKERQQGRGAGEAALELDRRRIRDRIAELKEELASISREASVRRSQRREARRVALVGYTNAGKSSWMRALTGSHVLVEDKLFATLDTTVRALEPEVKPRVLVSDTVGFIKKLPHDLVASFKSTLDEALEASLILHVVDASDPDWESQLSVTRDVLAEIGADAVPSRLVMNKVDRVSAEDREGLEMRFADAWFVSAKRAEDVARVHAEIVRFFESRYVEVELTVPYDRQRLVSEMHDSGRVLEQRYEERGVVVRLATDPETAARLSAELRA